MRIISRKTLRLFWERSEYADSEQPLRAWFREASKADWNTAAEVKANYRSASLVGNDRVVFNIAGTKYRLVVRINYACRVIYIRFVGTHQQYERTDVKKCKNDYQTDKNGR